MKVTLASMFRDCEDKLDPYFERVARLGDYVDLRVVVAEGDSTDRTYERLADGPIDLLLKVDHGGPKYDSIDDDQRWAQIATVARAIIDKIDDPGDAFVWVEGDLMWETETMLGLFDDLMEVRAVAPMVFYSNTTWFYDTWGFRKDGEPMMKYAPYYYDDDDGPLIKIDSCGSCFVTDDWSLVTTWDGHWPFPAKGELWLDPAQKIRHPRVEREERKVP